MNLCVALNYGHLATTREGNPYSIRSYFLIIDCDTDSKLSQRQLSFDAGLAIHD